MSSQDRAADAHAAHTRAPASTTKTPSPWGAFTVVVAVAVLTILDVVKVNVVITPIQGSIGTSTTQTQLIIAGYVLAFGIALVPAGRLGDQWNRKAMFLIGLSVFAAASLTAALSPNPVVLVTARIIQGVAAGIQMPQVLGVIQALFQGQQRGRAFGLFGSCIGFGTAFGPALGGFFVGSLGEELGWRWTFGMNVPLAILIIPLAIWLLPKRQPHDGARDLDLIGTALMSATVLFMMLPLVLTTGAGDSALRFLWFLPGVLAATGFVFWERHYVATGRSPVLDLRLFSYASYRYGVIIGGLWFAVMPAVFLVVTLYNQQGLGHVAFTVGLITIPYALVSAIVAGVIGNFTFKWAPHLVIFGIVIFALALAGLLVVAYVVEPANVPLWMSVLLGIAGVGPGVLMAANQMRVLKHVPIPQAGVAGSFQQVGQRVGNALGTAIATAAFYSLSVGATRAVSGEVVDKPTYEFQLGFEATIAILIGILIVALVYAILDLRSHLRDKSMNSE